MLPILVLRDTVSIRLGDIIPADAGLLEGDPVKVNQVITQLILAASVSI